MLQTLQSRTGFNCNRKNKNRAVFTEEPETALFILCMEYMPACQSKMKNFFYSTYRCSSRGASDSEG